VSPNSLTPLLLRLESYGCFFGCARRPCAFPRPPRCRAAQAKPHRRRIRPVIPCLRRWRHVLKGRDRCLLLAGLTNIVDARTSETVWAHFLRFAGWRKNHRGSEARAASQVSSTFQKASSGTTVDVPQGAPLNPSAYRRIRISKLSHAICPSPRGVVYCEV
jgi:hypothetical protein